MRDPIDAPTLALDPAPELPALPSRTTRAPSWLGGFAATLFIAAVGIVGVRAASNASHVAASDATGDRERVELIAGEHLRLSARAQWALADALACGRVEPHPAPFAIGPLGTKRTTITPRHACVAFDTTADGVATVAKVKLAKRGDFWCVDERAPIACE